MKKSTVKSNHPHGTKLGLPIVLSEELFEGKGTEGVYRGLLGTYRDEEGNLQFIHAVMMNSETGIIHAVKENQFTFKQTMGDQS